MSNRICPYPGLRTFTEQESIYFKGREDSIKKAVELVQKNKFLMLTGSSGDGKSSMVFAGIIPQARAGIFSGEFPNWLVLDFKPQRNPLASLADILSQKLFKGLSPESIEEKLSRGFSALVDLYKSSDVFLDKESTSFQSLTDEEKKKTRRKAKNLLIIVDQFEELFTNPENFINGVPSQSSKTLINLIVEANKVALQDNIPLYVICTMRSDYFGNCSSFNGLPELIGQSQYFIPRLTRKDIYRAIEDPAVLSGNKIDPRLVERLLFEVKEGADILPVIQHALFRLWKEYDLNNDEKMDLIHFAKIGGMPLDELPNDQKVEFEAWFKNQSAFRKKVLSNPSLSNVLNAHANELNESAIHELIKNNSGINIETAQRIIKTAFLGMIRLDHGKAVRNRISVEEVEKLIDQPNITAEVVYEAVKIFGKEENSLIRTFYDSSSTSRLDKEIVLDITHEALIRNWKMLGEIIKEESENTIVINDLAIQTAKWLRENKSKGFLLPEGQYAYFSKWYKEGEFSAYYIRKKFESNEASETRTTKAEIEEYLTESSKVVNLKKKILKGVLVTISLFLLIAVWGFFSSNKQKNIANKNYKRSKSNELAMNSFVLSNLDPTKAFNIAESAYLLDSSSLATQALTNSYINGVFYSSILLGHNNIVNYINYSGSQNKFVTCSAEEIFIWDGNGKKIADHYDAESHFTEIRVSNDGSRFVIFGTDNFASIFDMQAKLIKKIHHEKRLNQVSISADNMIYTCGDDGVFKIWDWSGNNIYVSNEFNGPITTIDVRKSVFFTSGDCLYKFEPLTKKTEKIGSNGSISTQVINLNDRIAITHSNLNEVTVWENGVKTKTLFIDTSRIVSLIHNPDNDLIGVKTNSINAFVFDPIKGKVFSLKGHTNNINGITINKKGDRVLTSSDDQTVKMWDKEGKLMKNFPIDDITYATAFSKDENSFISIHNTGKCILWKDTEDTADWKVTHEHDDLIWWMEESPDHKTFGSTSWDGKLKIWNGKGKCIETYSFNEKLQYLGFSPDSKQLVVTGVSGLIALINLETSQCKIIKLFNQSVSKACFSTDGKFIYAPSSAGEIALLTNTGEHLKTVRSTKSRITFLVMSKEGWFIASHSDGTSAIWDKNCNLIKKLEGQTGSIYRCAISSNDSLIATGSREGDIFIWSKKGEFIDSIRPEGKLNITSVKFSNKNPAILAFGSQTGVVGMCNLKTKTRIQKHSHTSLINTVYFNETDELIVTASDDGLLKTFDLELNEKVTYKGHKGVVQFANFMNNNKYILSGGQDGTIYKWPVKLKTILDWKKDAEQKGLIYQLSPEDKIKYGISESN